MFRFSSIHGGILTLVVLFTGIGSAAYFVFHALSWHINIPVHDQLYQLDIVERFVKEGVSSVSFEEWTLLHSGAHRIVFSRVGMALDYKWFGGQNYLTYVLTALMLCCALLAHIKFITASFKENKSAILGTTAVALFWLFTPTQIFNWVNPINNSWFVSHSLILLSLFLVLYQDDLKSRQALLSFVLCAVAALSTFSGVPALILLIAAVLWRSLKMGLTLLPFVSVYLFWLLDGVVSGNALIDQYAPQLSQALPWWHTTLNHFEDILVCLSSPLSRDLPVFGSLAAAISLVYLGISAFHMLRFNWLRRGRIERFKAFCIFGAGTSVAVALASSIGRSILFEDPNAPRYQTFVCFYWFYICSLVMVGQEHNFRDNLTRYTAIITLMLCFIAYTDQMTVKAEKIARLADNFYKEASLKDLGSIDYRGLRSLTMGKDDFYQKYDAFFIEHNLAHRYIYEPSGTAQH